MRVVYIVQVQVYTPAGVKWVSPTLGNIRDDIRPTEEVPPTWPSIPAAQDFASRLGVPMYRIREEPVQ